ncbi:hypothetical protein DSECCO2_188220 [anaerobic digester metagenome]
MQYFSFSFAAVGRFNLNFNLSKIFFIYFAKYFFVAKMLYSGYSPLQKMPNCFFRIREYILDEKNRELVRNSQDERLFEKQKNTL